MPACGDWPYRRLAWLACVLLALVTAGPIVAQEAPSGAGIAPATPCKDDNAELVGRLNTLVSSLAGPEGNKDDPKHVDAMLDLSVLLTEPCCQVRWLLDQAMLLKAPLKLSLAQAAVARWKQEEWVELIPADCDEWNELQAMANPQPLTLQPDAAKSTITAEPATVVADGTATATITVTLIGAGDERVSHHAVSLAPIADVRIEPESASSDSEGSAQFTAKSAVAREVEFTATDNTANPPLDLKNRAKVTFKGPEPPPPPSAIEALDTPAKLKERVDQDKTKNINYQGSNDSIKFTLLARGVDDDFIFMKNVGGGITSQPAWDIPRTVLDGLAKNATPLPLADKLLGLRQKLSEPWQKPATGNASTFSEQQRTSFRIAAALLDRALGLDETDLKTVTRQAPFDYDSTPAAWAKMAADLESDNLWRWAALARLLEAAGYSDEPSRQKAAGLATQQWRDKTRLVLPGDHWKAVDGWIERLSSPGPDQTTASNVLALRRNFREAARKQRLRYEDILNKFKKVGEVPKDISQAEADELFKNIQLAKAADVLEYTLPDEADKLDNAVEPLTLEKLKGKLRGLNESCVFIELIELSSGPEDGAPIFCGVALTKVGSKAEPTAVVLPEGALASLVRRARASLTPNEKGVRIVIAPDGALPLDWFQTECELLPFAEKAAKDAPETGWVVYVPSAAALDASGWTLDKTLRVWYRTGLRTGHAPPVVPAYPQDLQPLERVPNNYLPAGFDNVRTYPVWLGEHKDVPSRFLDLLKAKDDQCKKPGLEPYRVVPLVVSKGG